MVVVWIRSSTMCDEWRDLRVGPRERIKGAPYRGCEVVQPEMNKTIETDETS